MFASFLRVGVVLDRVSTNLVLLNQRLVMGCVGIAGFQYVGVVSFLLSIGKFALLIEFLCILNQRTRGSEWLCVGRQRNCIPRNRSIHISHDVLRIHAAGFGRDHLCGQFFGGQQRGTFTMRRDSSTWDREAVVGGKLDRLAVGDGQNNLGQ